MKKLIFATNNAHKLEEVSAIVGSAFEIITLREAGITEDIPEEEPTIEGNALAKALSEAHPAYTQHATPPTDTTLEPTAKSCSAKWRVKPTALLVSAPL